MRLRLEQIGGSVAESEKRQLGSVVRRLILLAAPLAALLFAGQPRQWQIGKITDAQSGRYGARTPSDGGALTRMATVFGNHDYVDYNIESDQYLILVQLKGSAHMIVNAKARFAIDGQFLWLIDADGKERKTKILKQILKETQK